MSAEIGMASIGDTFESKLKNERRFLKWIEETPKSIHDGICVKFEHVPKAKQHRTAR